MPKALDAFLTPYPPYPSRGNFGGNLFWQVFGKYGFRQLLLDRPGKLDRKGRLIRAAFQANLSL